MVTASPRANATVAMITTATPAASTNFAGPVQSSVSPSTAIPSDRPTSGFATTMVGIEAVSAPARNDDCWKIIPASAAAIQT